MWEIIYVIWGSLDLGEDFTAQSATEPFILATVNILMLFNVVFLANSCWGWLSKWAQLTYY